MADGFPGWPAPLLCRPALWSPVVPARIDGRVVALHARHKARIEALRRKCRHHLAATAASSAAG